MMDWSDGPREQGCIYHKRGVCALGADSLMVDVYVMPSIASTRPIAVTIGRYRHDKPMRTEHWQLHGVDDLSLVPRELPMILAKVGVRPQHVPTLTSDVEELLLRESATLTEVLSSVARG